MWVFPIVIFVADELSVKLVVVARSRDLSALANSGWSRTANYSHLNCFHQRFASAAGHAQLKAFISFLPLAASFDRFLTDHPLASLP